MPALQMLKLTSIAALLLLSGCIFNKNQKPVKAEKPTKTITQKPVPSRPVVRAEDPQGPTVDDVGFDYPHWIDLALRKISNNLENHTKTRQSLTCVVFFEVSRIGKILTMQVRNTSGMPDFDDACLSAVRWSEPLPPFPTDYKGEKIGITVPFNNK